MVPVRVGLFAVVQSEYSNTAEYNQTAVYDQLVKIMWVIRPSANIHYTPVALDSCAL